MARRPPRTSTATLGRLCVMTNKAEEKARNEDELSLREELARLQTLVRLEKKEEAEARQRLRQDELLNQEKDKQLHDLLCTVKGASGVPLAELDQVREEFAVLLSVKDQCFEMRQTLDEKENCLVAMQEELRTAQVQELSREVADAKEEASRRAQEWEDYVNANEPKLASLWQTARVQRSASSQLQDKLAKASRELRQVEEQAERHEKEASSIRKEVESLRNERSSVEKDLEVCKARLDERANDEALRLLQESVKKKEEELEKLKDLVAAAEKRRMDNCGVAQIGVCLPLLETSFQPLKASTDPNGPSSWLLHRLKQALAAGSLSGIDLLRNFDGRRDGRLSVQELGDSIRKMQIKGTSQSSLEQLVHDLDDALMVERRVSIVDLILSLPLHRGPAGPSLDDLENAIVGFVWACRRAGKVEGAVRQSFSKFISTPSCDITSEVLRLCCDELSVPKEKAVTIAEGLELRRESFLCLLPSWTVLDAASQGLLLVRFLRSLAPHRRRLAGKLGISSIPLEVFRTICSDVLSNKTLAPSELEEVALLSEGFADRASTIAPPTVDGARLLRACQSGGFQNEFPELRGMLPSKALQVLDQSLEAHATKEASGFGAAAPEPPPLAMNDPLASQPAAPLPTALPTSLPSPSESAAVEPTPLPPLPPPSSLTAGSQIPVPLPAAGSQDFAALPTPTLLPPTTGAAAVAFHEASENPLPLPTPSMSPSAVVGAETTAPRTSPTNTDPESPASPANQAGGSRRGAETDYDDEDFDDEEDAFEEDEGDSSVGSGSEATDGS